MANRTEVRTGKAAVDRGAEKPHPLPVCAEGIPARLKEPPQWVCWSYLRKQDSKGNWKWDKLPLNPRTGQPASSTGASTWGTFAEALAYHRSHPETTAGIGFVFSADGPQAGVDLDDSLNPDTGEVEPWALELLRRLDSYSEVSPSNTGVKVF